MSTFNGIHTIHFPTDSPIPTHPDIKNHLDKKEMWRIKNYFNDYPMLVGIESDLEYVKNNRCKGRVLLITGSKKFKLGQEVTFRVDKIIWERSNFFIVGKDYWVSKI